MQVHIFRGTGHVFAFVLSDSPDNLPEQYGPWAPFRTIEVVRGEAQQSFNADECLDDLAQHGIHVTDAHVRITDKVVS